MNFLLFIFSLFPKFIKGVYRIIKVQLKKTMVKLVIRFVKLLYLDKYVFQFKISGRILHLA